MHSQMSSEIAIHLTDISKCYQTYSQPAYRLLQALYGRRKKLYEEFWALKNIDLEIYRGETLGIVGKNGCGKSTLLQVITGTLTPTVGSVEARGRISALLELGAGFNPEFTGIENARLNASILGIGRDEIEDSLPAIIDFSELGEFVYRPVKTYSSGMYVRLAFSVAINMKPDIFIIDEALAVGDIRFQRKCFRKLEAMRTSGITILFVTHSTETVVNLCNRAVFLDNGQLVSIGEPKEVVNQYLESLFSNEQEKIVTRLPAQPPTAPKSGTSKPSMSELNLNPDIDACITRPTYNKTEFRWGDGRARIIDYLLLSDGKEVSHSVSRGDTIEIRMSVRYTQDLDEVIYGLTVKTVDGTAVYGTNTRLQNLLIPKKQAGEIAVVCFKFTAHLMHSEYFLSLGIAVDDDSKDNIAIDRRYDLIHLHVTGEDDAFGLASLNASIEETGANSIAGDMQRAKTS
jgi:lipopolysaccharide transport system ATP-binding protein